MSMREALREAQRLRLKMQTDSRFHLEVLAALSRTFRENGESISNNLLRSLVFAVPDELPGRGAMSAMVSSSRRPAYARIPPQPGKGKAQGTKGKGKKKKAKSIPPQPGSARGRGYGGIPPQPGSARGSSGEIPPQPGGAGRSARKKAGKKR